MKFNFPIPLVILLLLGCKSGFDNPQTKSNVDYQVINAFISSRKIKAIKKETFKPMPKDSLLMKLVSPEGLNLFHYDLTENQKNIDFENIFSNSDLLFLKERFKRLEIVRLDKIKLLETVTLVGKLNRKQNARMIAMPVIVPHKNYAFIYSESQSDGDLFCMKNESGKWVPFASFPLWTSD